MKLRVLSVIVEFSLLPVCEFGIQDAPLGGWFIVTPEEKTTLSRPPKADGHDCRAGPDGWNGCATQRCGAMNIRAFGVG